MDDMTLIREFDEFFEKINSNAIRKTIKQTFPNDMEAVRIALIVETLMTDILEKHNKILEANRDAIAQMVENVQYLLERLDRIEGKLNQREKLL